jgi:hypothetical protein
MIPVIDRRFNLEEKELRLSISSGIQWDKERVGKSRSDRIKRPIK